LRQIFEIARAEKITPAEAADHLAESRIRAAQAAN
jgi:hypothetical protein